MKRLTPYLEGFFASALMLENPINPYVVEFRAAEHLLNEGSGLHRWSAGWKRDPVLRGKSIDWSCGFSDGRNRLDVLLGRN